MSEPSPGERKVRRVAVAGLERSGAVQYVPKGILAQVEFLRLQGRLSGRDDLLREAEHRARLHGMRLHEADVELEWTWYFIELRDIDKAERHLRRAREIVDTTGYGRRKSEVAILRAKVRTMS